MLTIARLFGKSPFAPLETHMDKVAACISELPSLFEALLTQDENEIQKIRDSICKLEHDADLTKNDIRNHLPRSLFLPVDRGALLEILSLQDALADKAEDIAQHALMRKLPQLAPFKTEFLDFASKNLETFWLAYKAIKELEELLESSFGGIEAQKVKGMVEEIAFSEYEMTQIQIRLMTRLYREGDEIPYREFHLIHTLIEEIGCLARLSEKLGNRVRMLLELK